MKKNIFLIYLIMQCIACKKDVIDSDSFNNIKPASFSELYYNLWKGISDNYVYWDIDTTDWNRIYHAYKPTFDQLDINKKQDILKLPELTRQMTNSLLDGHFQIIFNHEAIKNINIYPLANRNGSKSDFHVPIDYLNITRDYFDNGYSIAYDSITNSSQSPLRICLSTISNNITYISFNHFSLFKAYHSSHNNVVKKILDSFFYSVNNINPIPKGIIVDVRNNFGGDVADLNFFVGNLLSSTLHFGYTKYKLSEAAQHYTPWIESYVTGKNHASINTKIPIVLLVDNYSASMAETMAVIVKLLPKGKVVGERTWGATGPVGNRNLYRSGQFEVAGFCHVYLSSAAFKDINEKTYESLGILPDIEVAFNIHKLNNGIDSQLEEAIRLIGQ